MRSSQPPAPEQQGQLPDTKPEGPWLPLHCVAPLWGTPSCCSEETLMQELHPPRSHHAHCLWTRACSRAQLQLSSSITSNNKVKVIPHRAVATDRRGEWPAGAGDQTPCHLPSWAAAMLYRQALHCPREGCGPPLERAAGPAAVQGGQQRRRSLLCWSQGCYDHCWAIHSSLGIKARLDIPATICWMSADQEGGYPQRRSRPPRGSWF